MDPNLDKIISGGQTGVDRAALDVAIKYAIPHGGWCPLGRLAEDGVIDDRYALRETDSKRYSRRTTLNVRDSDGTLILNSGSLSGGTEFTVKMVESYRKPCLIVNLDDDEVAIADIVEWIKANNIRWLNVAGPRESKQNGIYHSAYQLLESLINFLN